MEEESHRIDGKPASGGRHARSTATSRSSSSSSSAMSAGECALVEADAVRGGIDHLHLVTPARSRSNRRIEERVSPLVELRMHLVDVSHRDENDTARSAVVLVRRKT